MKTIKTALFSLACSLLIFGCSSDPSKQILGKWKYDHMKYDDGDGSKIGDDLAVMLAEKQLGDITMEFFEDGTRVSSKTSTGKEGHDKYWLESDNTYLCTQKDKDSEIKRTQFRLSGDTLIMSDKQGEIYFVRVGK
jgi:hypothetical protein